jgi:hypothetical protein
MDRSFLSHCDGVRTVRDHLEWLKGEGLLPPEAPEAEFAALVRSMLAGAFLEVLEIALPGR